MPARHNWTWHSTKSITFAGGTGTGAAGTVTVFTVTGRVILHALTAFCTSDLTVSGAATIELGVTGQTAVIIVQTTASGIDANEWWGDATPIAGSVVIRQPDSTVDGAGTAQAERTLSTDVIATIATADVTGGTLIFDAIYTPLTDGARLT